MFGYKIFNNTSLYDLTSHNNRHYERGCNMNRVLRKYIPYEIVEKEGINEIIAQTIVEWENMLNRSLERYYGNVTHEFLVITYEVKIELVMPMYTMKR